ncbi:Major facilitator superfamily domain general substrate transporter [Penicillium hordei]|uniref:Major facilitator superfamily domain general substrate transporter n=1 Tax=Penicillium hordei TaxID=40994 RepID=A0AAD6H9A7_9EURO|nr:Major facilitator superfamily domain general substrate transporter [Penicillium hordei]KAJ5617789.1 Major facilitator superfamily domain general substrate transporter [Penicillium hordei]
MAFGAFQYAAGVGWLTAISCILSRAFPESSYLFSSAQMGYTNVSPLVGNILGVLYSGFLDDRPSLYYAKQNQGYYEPEMGLYILHLPAVFMAGGITMFGATISRVSSSGLASAVLVITSHRSGDVFTVVAFMRNAISIAIPFATTPWIQRNDIQNMSIS